MPVFDVELAQHKVTPARAGHPIRGTTNTAGVNLMGVEGRTCFLQRRAIPPRISMPLMTFNGVGRGTSSRELPNAWVHSDKKG